jgi:antitoxin component YwqK of YwqJK toxin-antitoxin module
MKKSLFLMSCLLIWFNASSLSQVINTPLINHYRFNECDIIAILKIVSIENLDNENSIIHFKVIKNYKGDVEKRKWVRTHTTTSISPNNEYIVYGKYIGGDAFITQHENDGTHSIDTTIFTSYKFRALSMEQQLKQKFNIDVNINLYEKNFLDFSLITVSDTSNNVRLYPNGTAESQGKFIDNIPIGKWTYYFPNGSIQAKGYYKFGQKDGFWQECDWNFLIDDENKCIVAQGQYFLGRKVGEWTYLDNRGKCIKTRIYD